MSVAEADKTVAEVWTEDGELPEGWTTASLGDGIVTDVQLGFACGANNGAGDTSFRPLAISPYIKGRP